MDEVAAVALPQRVQDAGLVEVEEAGQVLHAVAGRGVRLGARPGVRRGTGVPTAPRPPIPQPYLLHVVLLHLQDGSVVVQLHLHLALGQGAGLLRPQLAACEGTRGSAGPCRAPLPPGLTPTHPRRSHPCAPATPCRSHTKPPRQRSAPPSWPARQGDVGLEGAWRRAAFHEPRALPTRVPGLSAAPGTPVGLGLLRPPVPATAGGRHKATTTLGCSHHRQPR